MDFARTGPGTLAGRFMRQFWQPIAVVDELAPGRPVPVEVMQQHFTLRRDRHGCHLADSQFRTFPVQEYFGLVFAFLGQGPPPLFPRFTHIERRGGVVDCGRGILPYNYFQQVENSVDEVHVVFVHRESPFGASGLTGVPRVEADETDFGITVRAVLPDGNMRIMHLLMPTVVYVSVYPFEGSGWRELLAWRVPVSDEEFQTFFLLCADVKGDAAARYMARPERCAPFRHNTNLAEIGHRILSGELSIHDVRDPRIVAIQDFVSQRGQGVIADREHEHLGRSDAGIILLRRIWEREMRLLAAGQPLKTWRIPNELSVTSGV